MCKILKKADLQRDIPLTVMTYAIPIRCSFFYLSHIIVQPTLSTADVLIFLLLFSEEERILLSEVASPF